MNQWRLAGRDRGVNQPPAHGIFTKRDDWSVDQTLDDIVSAVGCALLILGKVGSGGANSVPPFQEST
jgi:hypothetical protein